MDRARINLAPLALAAIVLGAAIQVRDGLWAPLAVALLALTCAAALDAILARRAIDERWTDRILSAGLLVQLALLFTDFPGSHHHVHARREYWPFLALIGLAVVVTIALIARPRLARVAVVLFVAIYLGAGVWLLRFTRQPLMDVFAFQRDACAALAGGTNPYAITFPNAYGPAGEWVYGPGLVRDGRLLFGFPYMPLTLAMELPAHVLLGDYRFALLLSVVAAALLIGWGGADAGRAALPNGPRGAAPFRAALCAAILLFTPRGFYLIEQGWCEPLVVCLLAATVVTANRWPRATPLVFGLLLAAKQYDVLMAPLGLMLIGLQPSLTWRRGARFFAIAIAVAAATTLPLVLWDSRAFWESAVMLQFRQPFRADSLSFAALIANLGGPRVGPAIALLAAALAVVVCLRRLAWSGAGFAIAAAVTYLALFALSKQAFANYYFVVITALCCGVANSKGEVEVHRTPGETAKTPRTPRT